MVVAVVVVVVVVVAVAVVLAFDLRFSQVQWLIYDKFTTIMSFAHRFSLL